MACGVVSVRLHLPLIRVLEVIEDARRAWRSAWSRR